MMMIFEYECNKQTTNELKFQEDLWKYMQAQGEVPKLIEFVVGGQTPTRTPVKTNNFHFANYPRLEYQTKPLPLIKSNTPVLWNGR